MGELVSVIVPTYNEDGNLSDAIGSVRADDDTSGVEVIVADGGSDDRTPTIANALADRVVSAPRNRAAQLNTGAAAARGSTLLFLHADSRLAPGSLAAIRRALADESTQGGAFTLRIGSGLGLRVVTWGTNFRSRWLRLPYGDQAIFTRASTFRTLGGFRQLEIMEDVDFVQRLRRIGRLALIDLPVATSARRWEKHGLLRTTFANASALALFRIGIPPNRIRRFYDALVPRIPLTTS